MPGSDSIPSTRSMNRVALTSIAPEIYRKRLLVEGYFRSEVTYDALLAYFDHGDGENEGAEAHASRFASNRWAAMSRYARSVSMPMNRR